MKKLSPFFLMVILFGLVGASSAFARAPWKECNGDVEQFCKGVSPSQGGLWICLRENHDALSEACKAKLDACEADRKKFCKEAKGKEIWGCLKDHRPDLSEICRSTW